MSDNQLKAITGHQWKPGQSGNPGGRPRMNKALQARCREYNDELIDILMGIARASEYDANRVSAAKVVLAYGNGLPQANVKLEDSGERPANVLTREQLVAIASMPIPEVDNDGDDEQPQH